VEEVFNEEEDSVYSQEISLDVLDYLEVYECEKVFEKPISSGDSLET
jgi:hypothetical protein